MDSVRGQLLLLAQVSTAEIKGCRIDIIHNFDKESSTCRLLQRNWEWKILPLPVYDSMVSGGSVRVCTGQLIAAAAAAYGLWSYGGISVPRGSLGLGVGEPGK